MPAPAAAATGTSTSPAPPTATSAPGPGSPALQPAAPGSAPPAPAPSATSGATAGTGTEQARPRLSLDEALDRFNKHGFDLVVADAQIAMTQADRLNLTAPVNPSFSVGVGKTFGYDPSKGNGYDPNQPQTPANQPCSGCSEWQWGVGLTDNAAIMRFLAGKRELRSGVADAAIAAARMNKEDARRVLASQVKASYVEVARATKALALAKETQESWTKMLNLSQVQIHAGSVDDGALARVETAKLQADVTVDQVTVALESAKYTLLFLLGDRQGQSQDFDVDPDTINFSVPARVNGAALDALLREARDRRPDLKVITAQKDHAQQGIELAKRERVPDVAVSVNYSQLGTGQNALSPPMVGLGLSLPLPIFYQNQGDIAHAQADLYQQEALEKKALAGIDTDVRSAWNQYVTARRIIERYETGGLLVSSQRALDIVQKQQTLGKQGIALMDVLDARRTYINVQNDRINQLAVYWNAVFALEQAVGADLRH
jgi:cobalt-zinc-cadmium efflux system outer membrane protein